MTERMDIMSFKWQNVMQDQARGMDPVSAYNKEKRRYDSEWQEQMKEMQNRLNEEQENRGDNDDAE